MDEQSRRRQQVREASRRLRKRRKDEQDALRAEVNNLRSLVDRLRSEKFDNPPLAVGEAGLGDGALSSPNGSSTSQREAALEEENRALRSRLEEATRAQRVVSDLQSTLRSFAPARQVFRLLASLSELDGAQPQTHAVDGEVGEPAAPPTGADASSMDFALSRLHAVDAAVAGITAHRLRPAAAAPNPQARTGRGRASDPAPTDGPVPPKCVVVIREPRPDGSKRERRVHVSAGGLNGEDIEAAALQAMSRLLPVTHCLYFTPAAVTRTEALEHVAIDALHGVPSVLASGWTPAAEMLPGLFLRSRNVSHPYPGRFAETYLSSDYKDTTILCMGVTDGRRCNITLGHGANAITLEGSQPVHCGVVPASVMKAQRRTFGRRLLRDQSAVTYELGFRTHKLPWPLQRRETLIVRVVQEVQLPSSRSTGVPTQSPGGEDPVAAASRSGARGEGTPSPVVPISQRRRTGRAMYNVERSITHPDHPEGVDAVRAITYHCKVLEELEGGGCRFRVAYHTDFRGQVPMPILQRMEAGFLRGILGVPYLVGEINSLLQQETVPSASLPRLGEELPPPVAEPAAAASAASQPSRHARGEDGISVKVGRQPRAGRRRQREQQEVEPDVPSAGAPPARRQRQAFHAVAGTDSAAAAASTSGIHGAGAAVPAGQGQHQAGPAAGPAVLHADAMPAPVGVDMAQHGLNWGPSLGSTGVDGLGSRDGSPASDASIHLENLEDLLAGLPPDVGGHMPFL